jgi:hypothetical protein
MWKETETSSNQGQKLHSKDHSDCLQHVQIIFKHTKTKEKRTHADEKKVTQEENRQTKTGDEEELQRETHVSISV